MRNCIKGSHHPLLEFMVHSQYNSKRNPSRTEIRPHDSSLPVRKSFKVMADWPFKDLSLPCCLRASAFQEMHLYLAQLLRLENAASSLSSSLTFVHPLPQPVLSVLAHISAFICICAPLMPASPHSYPPSPRVHFRQMNTDLPS